MKASKKVVIFLLILIPLLGIFLLLGSLFAWFPSPFDGLFNDTISDSERAVKTITESYPTDIVVLGDEIPTSYALSFRYIENLQEETGDLSGSYRYQVIIINDLDDSVQLTEQEVAYLNQLIHTEGYFLMYLGQRYNSTWDKEFENVVGIQGNYSYFYYWTGTDVVRMVGAWKKAEQEESKRYPEMLGEAVLYAIEDYIKAMQ